MELLEWSCARPRQARWHSPQPPRLEWWDTHLTDIDILQFDISILLCSIVNRALYRVQDLYQKTPPARQRRRGYCATGHSRRSTRQPSERTIDPGLAGIRKARAENPARGKGKRGGFRYMYYFLERDDEIYLLFLFDKGEQEDLNERQKTALRNVVAELKGS